MVKSRALVPILACLLGAGRCLAADAPATPSAPVESQVATAAESSDAEVPAVPDALASPTERPRWLLSGAPAYDGYRLSLSRGSLDFGLHFESRLTAPRAIDARFDSVAPPGATLPALSIGLRSVSAGPITTSNLAGRVLGSSASEPYVSKVGIEWKPAQSQVFFQHGLGFRLGEDERLMMRLRKGSLGFYMDRKF